MVLPPANHWLGTALYGSIPLSIVLITWALSAYWGGVVVRLLQRQPEILIYGGPPHIENDRYASMIQGALENLDGSIPVRFSVNRSKTQYSTGLDDNLLELREAEKNHQPAIAIVEDGWISGKPLAARRYYLHLAPDVIYHDDVVKVRSIAPLFESQLHIFASNGFIRDAYKDEKTKPGPGQSELTRLLDNHFGSRVFFGAAGTGSRQVCSQILLPAFGYSIDDFTSYEDIAENRSRGPLGMSIEEGINRMKTYVDRSDRHQRSGRSGVASTLNEAQDKWPDLAFFLLGKENEGLQDPRILANYQLVNINRSRAIATANSFLHQSWIRIGTYQNIDPFPSTPVNTLACNLVLAANQEVSTVQAYAIAQALLQSADCRNTFDLLKSVNKSDPGYSLGYPLHDGAKAALSGTDLPIPIPAWVFSLIIPIVGFLTANTYARVRRSRVTAVFKRCELADGRGKLRLPKVDDATSALLADLPKRTKATREGITGLLEFRRIQKEEFDWANSLLDDIEGRYLPPLSAFAEVPAEARKLRGRARLD